MTEGYGRECVREGRRRWREDVRGSRVAGEGGEESVRETGEMDRKV